MSYILIRDEDAICPFTLARVDKKDAITQAMHAALAEMPTTAAADDQVRVAPIRGQDKVRCSVRFVDALPESTVGKSLRRELRDLG
jgi:enoyl-CoA hydratase/carnithine racemase